MRIVRFLSAFEAALVLLVIASGCAEEEPPIEAVVVADGGSSDGSGSSGRATNRDAAPDRRDSTGGNGNRDAARDRPFDRSPRDAAPRDIAPDRNGMPDTSVRTTDVAAPPDTAGPDAAVPDAPTPSPPPPTPTPTPDAPTVPPPPVDSNPGVVTVTDDCQQACPQLFDVTALCDVGDGTCTVAEGADDNVRNICYANGIKKAATESSPTGTSFAIDLVVKNANGNTCYSIDIFGEDGQADIWTFKSPTGAALGQVVVDDDKAILTCGATGARFDITSASGCSGMEGEGNCQPGTCAP
jgi:hypothetical protein